MQKVSIKYNPYRLTTEILIDGKAPKRNSQLNFGDRRLQEWVDNLPEILLEECRTRKFEITFHGTVPDYEDIIAMAEEANAKGNIEIQVNHIPAKEVKDKEAEIKKVFEMIQKGPFEEFKTQDVINSFKLAGSEDFEVSVVATMSAGKSTLVNALLGQKLMPAKNEACTATITRIKDNDEKCFRAKVYDSNNCLIGEYDNLTYSIMEKLNGKNKDKDQGIVVSRIEIEGDIPFVTADDMSLVLVDTPGTNNARDVKHKMVTYDMLSRSSKTLVLYIMDATHSDTNDDDILFKDVANSMQVGGKQSRDRFIFVINKLDQYKKKEDSVQGTLDKTRERLAEIGIKNPNIYLASALTALNVRTILTKSDEDADEDDVCDAQVKVNKLNRREDMHFEKYAPLPASIKDQISDRLKKATADEDKNEMALIHSGIVSLEEAIRMYVIKYAKTAKIKNIADTFLSKLESAHAFENTIAQISKNKEQKEEIAEKLKSIKIKLKNVEEAKKFKNQIDNVNYDEEIKNLARNIILEAQDRIEGYIGYDDDVKLTRDQAEETCRAFGRFAENLQDEIKFKLEYLILNNVQKHADDLVDIYKKKLVGLVGEINLKNIEIDPFKMMIGEMPRNTSGMILDSSKTESVKVDEKWIENEDKAWYKPWTWFDEDGHVEDVMGDKEYIDGMQLAHRFFAPIQRSIYSNQNAAEKYAKKQVDNIKKDFSRKFVELDSVLQKKLDELESCATDEEVAKVKLENSQQKLKWLEDIQIRVNEILDI